MDKPKEDGDEFAELESIGAERPTTEARLRIEKEGTQVEISMPPKYTSHLLDAAVAALIVGCAVLAPAVTSKAMPEDLPHWVLVLLITLQLGIMTLVTVKTFTKPGTYNRPSG